jgi:hypothetical protein
MFDFFCKTPSDCQQAPKWWLANIQSAAAAPRDQGVPQTTHITSRISSWFHTTHCKHIRTPYMNMRSNNKRRIHRWWSEHVVTMHHITSQENALCTSLMGMQISPLRCFEHHVTFLVLNTPVNNCQLRGTCALSKEKHPDDVWIAQSC